MIDFERFTNRFKTDPLPKAVTVADPTTIDPDILVGFLQGKNSIPMHHLDTKTEKGGHISSAPNQKTQETFEAKPDLAAYDPEKLFQDYLAQHKNPDKVVLIPFIRTTSQEPTTYVDDLLLEGVQQDTLVREIHEDLNTGGISDTVTAIEIDGIITQRNELGSTWIAEPNSSARTEQILLPGVEASLPPSVNK